MEGTALIGMVERVCEILLVPITRLKKQKASITTTFSVGSDVGRDSGGDGVAETREVRSLWGKHEDAHTHRGF